MVVDATASNTGKQAGAAAILERHFKRKLMWIACRHHIFELVMQDVGMQFFGAISGPSNPFFTAIQKNWVELKKEGYDPLPIEGKVLLLRRENEVKELKDPLENRSREVASLIYHCKIWLFRGELGLSAEETEMLWCLNQLICLLYVIPWLKALLTAKAMAIDLHRMKEMQCYQRTGSQCLGPC